MSVNQKIENPGKTELRKFGLVTGAIVAALFGIILPWLFGYQWPKWPWIVTGILWVWAIVFPSTLFFVYNIWMKFGLVAGWINTRIILGIMFYLVFLPAGLVMRIIFRNDPMSRKLDSSAKSYRKISQPISKEHIERPY